MNDKADVLKPAAKPMCPSCYFHTEGHGVDFGGFELHNDPTCIARWARMAEGERELRLKQVQRLADDSLWRQAPDGPGDYWARREGCRVFSSVVVADSPAGLVVQCQQSVLSIAEYRNHQFQRKAA